MFAPPRRIDFQALVWKLNPDQKYTGIVMTAASNKRKSNPEKSPKSSANMVRYIVGNARISASAALRPSNAACLSRTFLLSLVCFGCDAPKPPFSIF